MSGEEPLLAVEHLRVSMGKGPQRQVVVHDNNLVIRKGKTVGLVGESGSGKSVTSLAIMGLLPTHASVEGSVRFAGRELLGLADKDLRTLRGDKIAMIFQDPLSSLNPFYTVGKQIGEAFVAHRGGTLRQARNTVIEAMERVHIVDAANRVEHYPHQFSGGMRQRIMIAMALCCEPDLIIADEPTTALDVTVQSQILELLASLQQETGMGMLFITHDLAVVSQVADDVLVMRAGKEEESGPVREVFARPQSAYTKMLLGATPKVDDNITDLLDPAVIRSRVGDASESVNSSKGTP